MVDFGVQVSTRFPIVDAHGDPRVTSRLTRQVLDLCLEIEEMGYDSIWVGDSLVRLGRLESITFLASLAGITGRVRLGTCAMSSFAHRDIVLLASQWATLDQLSSGRTILAVSIGGKMDDELGWRAEWEVYRQLYDSDPRRRVEVTEDWIQLLRQLWNKDTRYPLDFSGKYHKATIPNAIQPLPNQNRPPIWIASNPHPSLYPDAAKFESVYKRVLRRTALLADGWLTQSAFYSPEEFAETGQIINNYAKEEGRDNLTLAYFYQVALMQHDDQVSAVREETDASLRRFGYRRSKEVASREAVVGDADTQIRFLERVKRAGANHIIFRFRLPDQFGQLRRFTKEVLSSFRR